MKIGYHASHEQFSPSELLRYVRLAEEAGFQVVLSSDHFHPWSTQHSHSGFAWSWLGAAMQATSMEYGIVNAPGQRYHPAIIAQATATLAEMFPQRFWIAAGSGQALNEKITGTGWPAKPERDQRLEESVDIIKRLWLGQTVNQQGTVSVENAKLYTLPTYRPPLYGAALTAYTAALVSRWADGMITVNQSLSQLEEMATAFRRAKPEGSLILKFQVSYAASQQQAEEGAWAHWRNNTLGEQLQAELALPEQFDCAGQHITIAHIKKHVLASSDPRQYMEAIRTYQDMGFETIIFHNVNAQQEEFIAFMRQEILPFL